MYFTEVEEAHNVKPSERMNIAHSVVPQVVCGNANWLMKKLVEVAPMHWQKWTHAAERRRWEEVVAQLGCPELPLPESQENSGTSA